MLNSTMRDVPDHRAARVPGGRVALTDRSRVASSVVSERLA